MKSFAPVFALALACGGKSSPPAVDAPAALIDSGLPNEESGVVLDQNNLGVGGAMVCVLHHPEIPCATTSSTGGYNIGLPDLAGDQIAIEFTAANFLGEVLLEQEPATGMTWPTEVPLTMTVDAMVRLGTEAGFAFPGSGGFMELRIAGSAPTPLVGATASIAPAAGSAVYAGSDGTPMPALTATTESGDVLFGDLPAGVYEVAASAGSGSCTVSPDGALLVGDWPPGAAGATATVEVASGAITTNVNVICD
ncbi:MAG TPA: hypothetical protein VH143_11450 [Kofleriaceae bacterium]|jgi:hypothetical protein|nr:hypothetical protein [Kofleriaceae bacterium]